MEITPNNPSANYLNNSRKPAGKTKRVFKFILSSIALLIIIILTHFYILPSIFPKVFRGELQNIAAFPSSDGKYKLWMQTDGTFTTTSRTNNMGQISLKTVGWFCRTYSYVYSPEEEEIINGFKTSFDGIPPAADIIYDKGKIWIVNSSSEGVPPGINIYNSESYQQEMNTKSFCEKNNEVSSGIENVSVDSRMPAKLRIYTKDGRELLYSIQDDKFFPSSIELEKYYKQNDTILSGAFVLVEEENSDKRKKLYYLTGAKYELSFSYGWAKEIIKQNITAFRNLKAVELLPEKVFIEGEVLYTDDEVSVIIHQNNAGKNAERMLTCIDKSGKELWTIQQEDLFDEMEGREDETISDMSFLRNQLTAQRFNNAIILIYKPIGAMGFEIASGKKLWEFEG